MLSKLAQKMFYVFAGRLDAYGQDTGADGKGGMRVDAPLTPQIIENHLKGKHGVGVYPTWHADDGTLMASWGCCDIDTGDWSEAYALATTLRAMGMVPHIERSRSKGWHVWVFPEADVTAAQMRRALKVAYQAIELPAKEANPKQETLKPGQVGNYVRLPYKGVTKPGNVMVTERQTFMSGWDARSDGVPVSASDWLYEYDNSFTTPKAIVEEWAARWKEPPRKHIVELDAMSEEQLKATIGHLPGDLYLFVKNGPQSDRSAGLVALAHKLRAQGYTAKEIYGVITVAHSQWGSKYQNHHNPEKYLLDIVERCVQ